MYGNNGNNYDPYGFNDPYINARAMQNRINNQLYPTQQQQINQQPLPQNNMICRAVTSIDEARAAIMENPMAIYLFTDLANKKIYLKQMANNGTALLEMFEWTPIPEPVTPQSLEDKLMARLDMLEKKIEEKGGKNVKSNTTSDGNTTKGE